MLTKDLTSAGIIDQGYLKSSMDFYLLAEAGIIKDEEGHNKRVIKANTSLVYKQQKYNLLREEPEGYSKLVVLLESHCHTISDLEYCLSQMLSIIGHFELDPNRVLDLLLDLFEHDSQNLCYIELLRQFRLANVTHVLGNKFLAYHVDDKVHFAGTPSSLYILAAVLITADLVQLADIFPYLLPSLEVTADAIIDFAIRLKTDFATSATSPTVMSRCASALESHASTRRLWLTRSPLATESGTLGKQGEDTKHVAGSSHSTRPPPPSYPPPPLVVIAGNAPATPHSSVGGSAVSRERSQNENPKDKEKATINDAVKVFSLFYFIRPSSFLLITFFLRRPSILPQVPKSSMLRAIISFSDFV